MARSLLQSSFSNVKTFALAVEKVTFESNGDTQLQISMPEFSTEEVGDQALEMITAKAKELDFRGEMRLRLWKSTSGNPFVTLIVPKSASSALIERVIKAPVPAQATAR